MRDLIQRTSVGIFLFFVTLQIPQVKVGPPVCGNVSSFVFFHQLDVFVISLLSNWLLLRGAWYIKVDQGGDFGGGGVEFGWRLHVCRGQVFT